jgi:hypothetical protein
MHSLSSDFRGPMHGKKQRLCTGNVLGFARRRSQ